MIIAKRPVDVTRQAPVELTSDRKTTWLAVALPAEIVRSPATPAAKSPFENGKIDQVEIDLTEVPKDVPEAYERLIFDAIKGDSTFFAHWDEVELSWEWVQPILDAFEQNEVPLHFYPAGSNGPEASEKLLAANGYKWWIDSKQASASNLVSMT